MKIWKELRVRERLEIGLKVKITFWWNIYIKVGGIIYFSLNLRKK